MLYYLFGIQWNRILCIEDELRLFFEPFLYVEYALKIKFYRFRDLILEYLVQTINNWVCLRTGQYLLKCLKSLLVLLINDYVQDGLHQLLLSFHLASHFREQRSYWLTYKALYLILGKFLQDSFEVYDHCFIDDWCSFYEVNPLFEGICIMVYNVWISFNDLNNEQYLLLVKVLLKINRHIIRRVGSFIWNCQRQRVSIVNPKHWYFNDYWGLIL